MTTGSGLQINVVYEANVTSAPAGFKAAVQAAVDFFSTTFSALSTSLTIQVGWGTVNGHTIAAGSTAASSSPLWDVSYQSLRTLLARADASSPDVAAITAGLATIDPTAGAGQFVVTQAQAKALGFNLSNPGAIDGYVGLSSSTNFNYTGTAGSGYDAVGAIEHEITEILGRLVFANGTTSSNSSKALYSLLDLFRYTGTGAHTYQPGASYFSIDDGVHNLKDFNNGAINTGDDGDWATTSTSDAFDAFGRPGVLYNISTVDLRVMELLGYHLTPAAAAKLPPSLGPGVGGTALTALSTPTGGAITGTTGDDWLQGLAGVSNTLHGGSGSDYLSGGQEPLGSPNVNTATYDGVYRQYTVGTGGATVGGGPEGGMDSLVNIQRIQFVDGYLATGTTDTAGQVYRVYEATLGRAPDVEGLANWVHQLNSGTSLQTVVNGFVGSNEFQALYGNLDNTGFVTLLYNNVLHRAPDAGGLTSWLNYLAAGHSRAEVVTGFSESQEDINTLAAPVQQGLWVGDAAAGQAARLYDAVLGRLPDAAGLASWTHMLESGTTLQQAANGFTGSAEFQANYGSLNDSQFINLLYQNVLHRAADPSGLSNWLSYLASGHTRADVVLGFSESNEHIVALAPHIDNGVWVAG